METAVQSCSEHDGLCLRVSEGAAQRGLHGLPYVHWGQQTELLLGPQGDSGPYLQEHGRCYGCLPWGGCNDKLRQSQVCLQLHP